MPASTPDATAHRVPTPNGELSVLDHAGDNPPMVLLHGFPDDSRIYRRLVPMLRPRRALTLDFLGYGRSDRPPAEALDPADHVDHLGAVLDFLDIETAVVVGHDASGPDVVDFALAAPERVGRILLLNTYCGHASALRLPEMIRLLADPDLTPLADAMLEDPNQRPWLTGHTARRFRTDPLDPDSVGVVAVFPQFFGDNDQPDALPAIRAWTATLYGALEAQDLRISRGDLCDLDVPVTLIFSALDHYLNPDLADHLSALLPKAELHLVQGASHWPQLDQPQTVSR